ncbi:MAG: hypothetical protein O7G88_17760 [bacterium]|nr:hypothetical protein [bacterium]
MPHPERHVQITLSRATTYCTPLRQAAAKMPFVCPIRPCCRYWRFDVDIPTPHVRPPYKTSSVLDHLSSRSRLASQTQIGQETARLLKGTWPMSMVNPDVLGNLPACPAALNA